MRVSRSEKFLNAPPLGSDKMNFLAVASLSSSTFDVKYKRPAVFEVRYNHTAGKRHVRDKNPDTKGMLESRIPTQSCAQHEHGESWADQDLGMARRMI